MISEKELEEQYKEREQQQELMPDEPNELVESLNSACDLLKRTSILLLFLADPSFCKTITNEKRKILYKHIETVDKLVQDLDQRIAENFEEDA